jgi:hypothetical protein
MLTVVWPELAKAEASQTPKTKTARKLGRMSEVCAIGSEHATQETALAEGI